MWRCICANEPRRESERAQSYKKSAGKYAVADLTEQLAQKDQLVLQLQAELQDKETQLHMRDQQLKFLENLTDTLSGYKEALLEKTRLVDVLEKKLEGKNQELAFLEDLKEKLHKNEEALSEKTQLVVVLEKKLEGKNQELAIVPSRQELLELKDIAVDLEEENKQLHLKVNWVQHVEAQNENLQAKLEQYEKQQKTQADSELVTKGATSQTSESESAEELHSRLMKWREMDYIPTPSHDIDESTVMELRMRQLEEKREDLISELQEVEDELWELQRRGQDQGWTTQTTAGQKLTEKEELETLQESKQQEPTEQDPSSCKNELAELRREPLYVRPAPRESTIQLASDEECEEALKMDPSEQAVVEQKAKSRVHFFKRIFPARR